MTADSTKRHGVYEMMDAARALAATLVAVSHIRDLLLNDYAGGDGMLLKAFYFCTGFGHAGVVVFFVLSGFWITKSTVGRTAGGGAFWADYLIDRIARLSVVLVPALLVGGLLDVLGASVFAWPVYRGATGALSLSHGVHLAPEVLLLNLVYLQSLAGPAFGSNGPLWSLAYEFWFYLWFPAIWLSLRWRRAGWALPTLGLGLIYPALAFGFLSWVCGTALFALAGRLDRRVGRVPAWTIFVTGGIAFLGALTVIRVLPLWWLDPIVAFGFAWFLLGLYLVNPPAPRWLGPVARFGANSSFSLYAIHYPIAAIIAGALTVHGRLPPTASAITLVGVILAVIVLLGYGFSRLTEAHTAGVRRRFRRILPARRAA